MAKEGEPSLFKASQLLEFTFEAYQYARGAAQDKYDLKRNSEQHLSKFGEGFENVCRGKILREKCFALWEANFLGEIFLMIFVFYEHQQ